MVQSNRFITRHFLGVWPIQSFKVALCCTLCYLSTSFLRSFVSFLSSVHKDLSLAFNFLLFNFFHLKKAYKFLYRSTSFYKFFQLSSLSKFFLAPPSLVFLQGSSSTVLQPGDGQWPCQAGRWPEPTRRDYENPKCWKIDHLWIVNWVLNRTILISLRVWHSKFGLGQGDLYTAISCLQPIGVHNLQVLSTELRLSGPRQFLSILVGEDTKRSSGSNRIEHRMNTSSRIEAYRCI